MSGFDDRRQYESDQGVWVTGLPLLVAGALLAASGVAWMLTFLFLSEWYLMFLVPAVCGLLLGGVLHLLVGWTHCRIRWLAGGLGVLAGLVAYLGYYHLCLLHFLPPGNAARLDLLPRYIHFRMQKDVWVDVGRPQVGNQPKKPVVGLNWYGFASELAMLAGFPAAIAWRRAGRAYCRDLRQWMQREVALFPSYAGALIVDALQTGDLAEFVAKTPAGGDPQTACRLILEHAQPADGSVLSHPVYASIEDLPAQKPWYWPRKVRQTCVRQIELTTPEVLTLRPLFPKLARVLDTQHTQLRDVPREVFLSPAAPGRAEDVAMIVPVPEPYRQRVRTPGYALKVNLLGLTPVVFILGGLGLLALGAHFMSQDEVVLGLAPLVLGAPSLAWGIYVGLYCLCRYENRWIERRLRSELAQRPESLVDPDAPDVVYVSLIPRESWSQIKLTMSSDLLLMRIDDQRRAVLLEGDCDRYGIPSGAIAECAPQCFFHPIDTKHQNELWMVRLLIRVEDGMRELLLSGGRTDWRPETNSSRRKFAEETCQRINALRSMPLEG